MLDDLTIGEAKQLARMFGKEDATAFEVGKAYFIRTVTMYLTGRLVGVNAQELVLEDAAWIADTGEFAETLRTGELVKVEPFPTGRVIVGRGALVDACEWPHPLPRTQK